MTIREGIASQSNASQGIAIQGIAARQIRLQQSDYEGTAAIINASYKSLDIDRRVTAADIEIFVTAPDYVIDQSIIFETDGRIVGYGDFILTPNNGSAWADGVVHPDFAGCGIGQSLIDWMDSYILERANAIFPTDQTVTVRRGANSRNTPALDLFKRNGYTHARTFYEMRIDLADAQPPQTLPEGIRFVPFDLDAHGYTLYDRHEEAFSEHWGYQRDTWEEWQHYVYQSPKYDPTLWLIAWVGEEIAGYSINRQLSDDKPSLAWVGQLGVLKPWRKRGLGAALLNHSFALFKARGYSEAGLGVDAENTTNALPLYERVGMHVHKSNYSFEKRLR